MNTENENKKIHVMKKGNKQCLLDTPRLLHTRLIL